MHLYSQCRSTMKSGVEFGESVHSSISALFMMCAACLRTYFVQVYQSMSKQQFEEVSYPLALKEILQV